MNVGRFFKNITKKHAYLDILQNTRIGILLKLGLVEICNSVNFAGINSTDVTIQVKDAYQTAKKYFANSSKAK